MDAWRTMLRAELRIRWPVMVMLAVFVAAGVGATIGAAASAERTATAFQRLLDQDAAADLVFDGPEVDGTDENLGMVPSAELHSPTLDGVPGVTVQGAAAGVLATFPDVQGLRLIDQLGGSAINVVTFFALDDQFGRTIERPSLVQGHLPDPRRADEVFVSTGLADFAHWAVGDHVTIQWMRAGVGGTDLDPENPDDLAAFENLMGRTDVVITGIGEPIHRDRSQIEELLLMTPAFGQQPGLLAQYTYNVALLADGTRAADVIAAAGERGLTLQESSSDAVANYRDSVRPDVVSLAIFAVIAGIVTILVMGQALGREVRLGGADNDARRAVGATSGQLTSVALTRVGMIVACGVTVGTAVAALTTGWLIRGAAAAVEPTPGLRIDAGLVLGIAALLATGYLALAIWPAISASRAVKSSAPIHPSWTVRALTEISAPPLIVVGARHALERGAGRATVPQRTALAVGALGAALAVAALVFTSGLDRLVTDPTSYGVTWQMHIDINYDPQRDSVEEGRCTSPDGTCGDYQSVLRDRMAFVRQVLSDSPDIVAATPYSQEILELDGTTIGVYAMGDGPVQPTITAGRRPGDDEIALGRAVMTDLGVHIGDTVTTSDGLELSVVGVALVPDGLPGEALGHGGVVTSQTAQRIDDRDVPRGFLMRTSAGADTEALLAQLRSLVQSEAIDVEGTPRPAQIGDYRRIRSTPIVLALSLAAIGAGMLIVGVMSAVRRRRHEYALLQALGASPNQIVVAIQTQALVSYGVVLVFGLAIGVIGGGVAWNAFEHRLGTQSGVQWPLVTLLVAALVAGGLTVLLMQPVARRRAVQRPAGELRIE